MANEAIEREIPSVVRNMTCEDSIAITEGALLVLEDPNTVSGAIFLPILPVAGIAKMDKEASDGSTTISVAKTGVYECVAGTAIDVGNAVCISGGNYIIANTSNTAHMSGAVLGKALETATKGERIRVEVNC